MMAEKMLLAALTVLVLVNLVLLAKLSRRTDSRLDQIDRRLSTFDGTHVMMRHLWAKLDWKGYRKWRIEELSSREPPREINTPEPGVIYPQAAPPT